MQFKLFTTMGLLGCAIGLLVNSVALADAPIDATKGRAAPGTHERLGPQSGGPRGMPVGVIDDFNRADGPIGGSWTVHTGSCSIASNAAVCDSQGLATHSGADGATTLAMDVATDGSTSLQYAAIIQGYGGGSNNIFIKVQNNGGSGPDFTHVACYTGNNGSSFGLGFTNLDATFSSARMTVTRTGNDVQIDFTNVDGGSQSDQSYTCLGAPAPDGTGAGLSGYTGLATMDNFATAGGAPAPIVPETVPVNHPVALVSMIMLLLLGGWFIRHRMQQ
jgi:hypothetical protein